MRRLSLAALALLIVLPASAQALEIKNVRAVYGPFGAVRTDNKFVPGDVVFLAYTISGIKIDPASGGARYTLGLEILDGSKKSLFKKDTVNQVVATLGGDELPGTANVEIGVDLPPGSYQAKVNILDGTSKDTSSTIYTFEVLPKNTFGMIRAMASPVAFVSQDSTLGVTLVGWGRDGKKKPNIEVTTNITDEAGKATLTKPLSVKVPSDLPEEVQDLLLKQDAVQIPLPIYFNRPGRFNIEIEAIDQTTRKSAKLRFSVNVLEVNAK